MHQNRVRLYFILLSWFYKGFMEQDHIFAVQQDIILFRIQDWSGHACGTASLAHFSVLQGHELSGRS